MLGAWLVAAVVAFAAAGGAAAQPLGEARLLIAGTTLRLTPESQTVPFGTPTVVETHLDGLDPAAGVLPTDLRVVGELTGPEIEGVLTLETRPNEPFRIPRFSLKGEYVLDHVRLVQGDELLAFAQPRSAAVLVTQVLVTRVTSRPLTLDEIRSYGIVVDEDSFTAFNFTFGFAVAGETFDYNIPVIYQAHLGAEYRFLVDDALAFGQHRGTATPRFQPPRLAPFTLSIDRPPSSGSSGGAFGGCLSIASCVEAPKITLPGVILFPADVSLLNQFFSVVLAAKNDAPAGDPLVIRDLTAKVTLPPGLRMAQTEPPTPLGVPVPVRVPGADGKLGTGDDLTFLVAQASGEAQVLVEGRREGTHLVEFALEGVLDGLPGGRVERITGRARGAVVVRDRSLGITISHPSIVRAGEEYPLLLTVTNTANAPANLVTVALPASGLSGAEVVGAAEQTIESLLPGEAEVVEFRLLSQRTGRVVASSARTAGNLTPRFELTMAVGDGGIPLSPDTIILPDSADGLPPDLVREALGLVGLGYSLATAPVSELAVELPRLDLERLHEKVYWLAQAGRHRLLGEDEIDSLAVLAAEWLGARGADWEWDRLRRTTQRGGRLGAAFGGRFAAAAAGAGSRATFERMAATTAFLGPVQAVLADGSGVRLEVSSRTSGMRLAGDGVDPTRRRELPWTDLYALGSAELALLAAPEEGGYQARLSDSDGGLTDLCLLVPLAAGAPQTVCWEGLGLGAAGLAVVDFAPGADLFTLYVDADGDGTVDQTLPQSSTALAPRPFTALAAVQDDREISGHVVEVLFSRDVDLASLLPRESGRFEVPGLLSNGGIVPVEQDLAIKGMVEHQNAFAGLRNTRVVRAVFDNPVSPYVAHQLTVRDVAPVGGAPLPAVQVPVTTTVDTPGGVVEGRVIGPDGQPVAFARVELYEVDSYWVTGECKRHRTAAVRSDASGRFRFDYVRQASCSDVFTLRAIDGDSGHRGKAHGRVRFVGETLALDVVMLGRGTIRGRVTYDDGSVPAELDVAAHSPVFFEGHAGRVALDGTYEIREVPVGTITLGASDRQGSYVYQTIEVPSAGALVERDLVILRRPSSDATGDVRGVVYDRTGTSPVFDAYLALYVDGELVGVQRSAVDGSFDFGTVPAGIAELEAFDGVTGLAGAQLRFEVLADRVNELTVLLRDDRGIVEGRVYRQTSSGTVPVVGAVVWVSGTPFNTTTDSTGFYRLESVFAGNRTVTAADLERQEQVSESVTVTDGATSFRDLHFIESFGRGGIAGEVLGFTGSPVPGAKVHIATGSGQWWHESITNTQGRFAIPDLNPGTYELHAVAGGDSVGAKGHVTIRFEGDTPFLRLQFKKGTIRGQTRAVNESGDEIGVRSLITYRLTAVNEGLVELDWTPETLETDADGFFEISDVLAGPYTLSVTNAFHGSQTISSSLDFHGDVKEHDIVFQRNGRIGGTVLDWDGETPLPGATVYLRHPSFGVYDLTTDAEGRFLFDLVPPGGRFPIDVEYDDGAVFRRGRVWVSFHHHGQELDVELSVRQQGMVSGWVEDANGGAVAGAVVTLREHEYPHRRLVHTADTEGFFSFTNVFTGRVSLDAQAPTLGGLGAKQVVQVNAEGEEVWSLLVLEGTGEIEGQVTTPVDGSAVPSAQVTLYKWGGGVFDSVTADAEGRFRFRLLPIGLYRVWTFDPSTGRHGALDAVGIDFNGQVTSAAVELEVRGEVDGHLQEPGSLAAVPGATIRLDTESLVRLTTYSSADIDGYYEFLGIPEGAFRLSTREPGGRRTASAKGSISEEGERVTVDLLLEEIGRVVGTVLAPAGAPDGPFPNVNTLILEGGQVVGATFDNPFAFDGIVVGRQLTVRSYEMGGDHRGSASGVLASQGEELTVDVRMVPIGSVAVTVTDSFGAMVSGADLRLEASGYYGRRRLFASTGPDGRALFAGVGQGGASVFVINPLNGLKGSGSGEVTLDGQVVEIAVQLQDSGQITGRVLRSDGATPAVDALVVITAPGRTLKARADADGRFDFLSVPLGSFTVLVQESFAPGTIERRGTLATNGEVVDLGSLVLDDVDPRAVALSPLSGSRDLPRAATATVRFNEPLDRARFSSSWFVFRTLSGRGVGYGVAWSEGDTVATLTPTSLLANFTGYELIVNAAYDLAGRPLTERVKTVFYTADQVPPAVVDVLPRNGQVQVAVDTPVRITFSEPVELTSLSGSALQLTDVTTGQGITTTFQLRPGEREVILTPATALATDRSYQLTVQSVRDKSGNAMPQPAVTTFKTVDTLGPEIVSVVVQGTQPFGSGDQVLVDIQATDWSGVAQSRVVLGDWTFSDDAAPWQVAALAPVVSQATTVQATVEVVDLYGNVTVTSRDIAVEPHPNASTPSIEVLCGEANTVVVGGVESELKLAAADDEAIERVSLIVDDVEVAKRGPIGTASSVASFLWTPPAEALPGEVFEVRLEARDFAGNITAWTRTSRIADGVVLIGGRSLFDEYAGQHVTLAGGDFVAREPLHAAGMTVLRGARLTVPATPGGVVSFDGQRLDVQCGAELSAAGGGYAGGTSSHTSGYAPAGVVGSTAESGGSHGGRGLPGNGSLRGVAGEEYGSVYWPASAGGGAAYDSSASGPGGGVVEIEVGELVLDGSILSGGDDCVLGSGGGGGSVLVQAGVLRGAGRIDASGTGKVGSSTSCSHGAGGGGRVALHVTDLTGFDPATQVLVRGGRGWSDLSSTDYAAPGTLYVKQPGDTYGRLRIESGAGRTSRWPTALPPLGAGSVTAFTAAGADAWVSGASTAHESWPGAWMVLVDGTGTEVGAFEVAEVDAGGRVRLVGAGGVAGAASFRGEYRFDEVVVATGVGLEVSNRLVTPSLVVDGGTSVAGDLQVGELLVSAGEVRLDPAVEMQSLRVMSGAVVRPLAGQPLRIALPGTLTVEAGARLDATGAGYAAGTSAHKSGQAPDGVVGSAQYSGGSHGGRGLPGYVGGAVGEAYGSVYWPRTAGGGAAYDGDASGPGAGAVEITVSELVLEGSILSGGDHCTLHSGGAGGSVTIEAGVLRGGGRIDASGTGKVGTTSGNCNYGAGGGGRVALHVTDLTGFDALTQVLVQGGYGYTDTSSYGYAAPGTLYIRQPGDTYGLLRIESGTGRTARWPTTLPSLGSGAVTGFEAAGADAWVSGASTAHRSWPGAWMVLVDVSGTELGGFEVAEVDAAGRLRLVAAGPVAGAVSFRGEYRFDEVVVAAGAGLSVTDRLVTPSLVVAGGTSLAGDLEITELVLSGGEVRLDPSLSPQSLRVAAGTVVRPAAGQPLRIALPGTLTVEAGARLDATGEGYTAGTSAHKSGYAPDGVVGSAQYSGGSHGGRGLPSYVGGVPGEAYGSVYWPRTAGGGAAYDGNASGPGAGAVEITASELVLEGSILSGGDHCTLHSGGAGGSVTIEAGVLRGAGRIDASGTGKLGTMSGSCNYGAGGGGRVALHVTDLTGFDALTQVLVQGGYGYTETSSYGYAAPGTLYVKQPGDTHGRLRIESGVGRTARWPTALPPLGSGAVTSFEAAGADAWLGGASTVHRSWPGAWMVLSDGSGAELGGFEVAEVDAAGRLRLLGAGAVVGAASFRGEYRFDEVMVASGAGLETSDRLVTPSLVVTGGTSLGGDLEVAELVVASGQVRIESGVAPQNLRVAAGATARAGSDGKLHLVIPGTLTIEAGGAMDVSGQGYPGSRSVVQPGGAPAGIQGALSDSGGSHGGAGTWWFTANTLGEVYDSVYVPQLAGGGGSDANSKSSYWGGAGGGVVELDVAEIVLDGEIRALGERRPSAMNEPSGAGGTVLVQAGVLRGIGTIDASGGDYVANGGGAGSGGGGRVALYVDDLAGFDLATQVKAWGGARRTLSTTLENAAAGTIYVMQPGMTYGELRIDAGEVSGVDRVGRPTELPALGTGSVTALDADGWLTGATPFDLRWLGAWLVLLDGSGAELGTVRAVERDTAGRLRLSGAEGLSAAASYRGEYRFDRVDLLNGAGLQVTDPLVAPHVWSEGSADLIGPIAPTLLEIGMGGNGKVRISDGIRPENLTLRPGVVVTAPAGGVLRLAFPGTLTIETGAMIDVSTLGFPGAKSETARGGAPSGVLGALKDSGGSHGGVGDWWSYPDTAGEVYGSLYLPQLGGGGGSDAFYLSAYYGGAGGGVVDLAVDELVLDGEIRAQGERRVNAEPGGAGGSVVVQAGVLRGTGKIDASGADYNKVSNAAGSGGGGRVALYVDTLLGFDPATQVEVRGGGRFDQGTPVGYAAPGTLFVADTASTGGDLFVDHGRSGGPAPRTTVLPRLGSGTVGVAEADALDTADVWVEPLDPAAFFPLGAVGAWLRIDGADYRIVDQTTDRRRVLLDGGAALVDVGDAYQGVYKFDTVTVKNGAVLELRDPADVGTYVIDPSSQVITP